MQPASRYEILDTIATGDFATVYRARDRELGREVAIKQIHQQFLSQPQQLARYWQEAQLLASLQHPNILTIYDIDRPRGWLILELMRGSLCEVAQGQPIELDFLRTALAGCLGGLEFLHSNGIIHADVKPSNLLVDLRDRVVLADFGLARRASNEEGSLLKGTTKYMAPELVSNQFGPIGPASDLYSLGFSAYELICGPQFESLFPGLGSFGRDKQIAWMMWHAAADRKLPEIGRVLEGVPDDLARVVQKLVVKDQARRYQSAAAALRELKHDGLLVDRPPAEEDAEAAAAEAAEAKQKRRLRLVAVLAMAFSLMLCVAILLPKKPQLPPGPAEPTQGVVRNVYPGERKLVLELSEDGRPREINVKPRDRIFINDKPKLLRDLRSGDQALVEILRDQSGRRITEIHATRPEQHKGRIKALQTDEGLFTLAIEEGEDQGKDLPVSVPGNVKITLNNRQEIAGRPITLADLHVGDRVVVHHVGELAGRAATMLDAKRIVDTQGVVRDVDADKGRLTVVLGSGERQQLLVLPLASDCVVTVNGRSELGGQLLRPADLRPGDKVIVAHDTHVVRVDARRILGQAGVIKHVHYAAKTIDVVVEAQSKPTTYRVGPQCEITLGGEPVELSDLRNGDNVDIAHRSIDNRNPQAISVAAVRPADPGRWAILIANQNYDDRSLSPLSHPIADARLFQDVLIKRYRVPPRQAELLADESLVRLRQGIPTRLGQIGPDGRVIVYFAGHAYQDDQRNVYLAPKNFDFQQMSTTGLSLQWLVDQFEQCRAKEKLLLLDCSHPGDGADLSKQPSTAEMMQSLRAPPGRAPLRSVTAVASCKAGQRGLIWEDKGHGLFPWCLAEAYSGRADKNRDNRLEPTELFGFLTRAMASAGGEAESVQTPVLFLPDDRPPRLTDAAKASIRRLAAYLRQDRIKLDAVGQQYAVAEQLSGKQPEPKLLYSLLLLKAKQRDQAVKNFEELRIGYPELLLPLQGMVWARFEKRRYQVGVNELGELVSKIPKPKRAGDPYPQKAQRVFYWVGQLREFAAAAAQQSRRPSPQSLANLDTAAEHHGEGAKRFYDLGRARSRNILQDFDKRLAAAEAGATAARLKVERRRLVHYAALSFDNMARQILAGLDK